MASPKHIKQKISELENKYDLLSAKIVRLQRQHVYETDVASRFKLENQLKQAQIQRDSIIREIEKFQLKIEGLEKQINLRPELWGIQHKLWERYEELEPLGRGGIAEVYKVRNRKTNNISALKILLIKHHNDPQIIARFLAEGRILGMLASTGNYNIVQVRDVGRTADREYFIEMEFLPGKTLSQILHDDGKLPPKRVLELFLQLTIALKRAHEFNVVHRDLKPENIMIGEHDKLTLMDFGIAKRVDSKSVVTQQGTFVGTYAYSAPEQFSRRKFGKITAATDIYSFGILMFHLLTGEVPFGETTMVECSHRHCNEPLPQFPNHIPPEICSLIEKCTQKAQKDRYQTVDELHEIMKKIVAGELIVDFENLTGFRNLLGLEFILVKGGTFQMGSNDYNREKPIHEVTLDDFYISKYQITNTQYAKFLNDYGSDTVKDGAYNGQKMIYENKWGLKLENGSWKPEKGYENHPVVGVTWFGAYEFCRFYGFRLPTEAQWEYAARGGNRSNGYKYAGSNTPDEVAWYEYNSDLKTHPVGEKQANELGIYDMTGNVWEWCSDWYDEDYYQYCKDNNIKNNPENTKNTSSRVLRGGSWYNDEYGMRVTYRIRDDPDFRRLNVGFRISRVISK